jgi:hypothetical protein
MKESGMVIEMQKSYCGVTFFIKSNDHEKLTFNWLGVEVHTHRGHLLNLSLHVVIWTFWVGKGGGSALDRIELTYHDVIIS